MGDREQRGTAGVARPGARCGTEGHTDQSCELTIKCMNCGDDHMAYSRDCLRWTFEKQVQSIKVSQHLSYPEASKLITGPTPNKSFADIIKQSAKPQTKTISIQTDLHWPKNSASPIKIVLQKPTTISTQTSSSQTSSSQTSE